MSFPLVEKELLGSWEGKQGGDRDDTIPNSLSLCVLKKDTQKSNF
jgi:hypothetical protein